MVKKSNVLVTGSDGQLGSSLHEVSDFYHFNFFFKNKTELDIGDVDSLYDLIIKEEISCVINCAAFTNVDEAEINFKKAELINSISVGILANICSELDVQLIHISTDFVFDGNKNIPYTELDYVNPINNYGRSKLEGENKIINTSLKNSAIIRTSWLYSKFGNNFVNKVIKNIMKNENISVVIDQYGSPTNSLDLAMIILKIIPKIRNRKTEIFNFSNGGYCSRYDFATSIRNILNSNIEISKIHSEHSVPRPKFSALNSDKIKNKFNLEIIDWKVSLKNFFNNTYNGIPK